MTHISTIRPRLRWEVRDGVLRQVWADGPAPAGADAPPPAMGARRSA